MNRLISRQTRVSSARLKTKHVIVVHRPKGSILHYHVVVLALVEGLAPADPRARGESSLRLSIETRPITWCPIVCSIAVVHEHGRRTCDHIVRVDAFYGEI